MKTLRIVITGTPCTGKTKTADALARKLNKTYPKKFRVLHLNAIVIRKKFWTSIDKKRKTKNVGMKKLRKFVKKKKGNLILESHFAHDFPADIVFVLRCPIKELEKRMQRKHWNRQKIHENLEAERLNLILGEAMDKHKKVIEIQSSGLRKTTEKIAKAVKKIYKP